MRIGSSIAISIIASLILSHYYGLTSIPALLVFIQGYLIYQKSTLRNIPFLVISLLFICFDFKDGSTEVKLRPYEKEIRKLLLKYDPKILHKVDDLLARNRRYEAELYNQLKEKYVNTINDNIHGSDCSDNGLKSKCNSPVKETTMNLIPNDDRNIIERAKLEARSAIKQHMFTKLH